MIFTTVNDDGSISCFDDELGLMCYHTDENNIPDEAMLYGWYNNWSEELAGLGWRWLNLDWSSEKKAWIVDIIPYSYELAELSGIKSIKITPHPYQTIGDFMNQLQYENDLWDWKEMPEDRLYQLNKDEDNYRHMVACESRYW